MKKLLFFILLTFSIGQSQTPVAGPTSPPARNIWDVLSQYGSAYTNQTGVVFENFGGSNIVGDVTLADNSIVKKYLAHSYSGIKVNGAGDLNVSGMTHLHMDVWSPDFISLKVKLEGANGSNRELEVPFSKVQGSWNSYDLDLSTYSSGAGAVTLTNLRWIVPVTFGPNNTTLFISNVYFYRPATTQPPTLGTFSIPAQLVGAPNVTITPPTTNSAGAFSYISSNTAVAQIVNGNEIQITGGGTSIITANQAAATPYGAGSTIATFTASYPTPSASPVPPARASGTVVSMFTGTPAAYTNVVEAIRAPWTAGTQLTTIPNGDNTCLKVDNFGYLGYITPGANFSVAGMTKLHVDVYLNTPIANMFIYLLSNGDQLYNTGALTAGWNSLDISLTSFPAANLADIYGFKFEHNQGPARQIYLDNIYFYVAGSEPTITAFTVPAKVFGDADFALTAPTSNSLGAFIYSSGNTDVATIVNGNEIHIVGVGTAIISANQAANGVFDSGSITASLVVSAPPLAVAAPTPPARNAWDVVSLYSGAYANLPSAVWVGASTLIDEVLEGNATKKMSNFIVEFINFAATNVSQMTTLHMDIYTPDCPGFNIWLLNNGDRNAQIFPAVNGWRSIDIPLLTYVNNGLNMTALIQLKFEGLFGPGKTAYVDNVYFYRAATLQPPTVGTFTVPAKNVGAANFTITPPTSNNTSPFTYSSSNQSVAMIVNGNQIDVMTGGTSTITASQVSDGTYGPSSKSATFVVSFPLPSASPIPPARVASKVVSMFTGSPSVYANAINMVRSDWTAGTTLTTVSNGTNTAVRVDNLGYIGLVNQGDVNFSAAGMTNLHMDIYVNAPFSNLFFWILSNGDQRRDITNLVTGWNSIDIKLSEFPGANLASIYGLKFEQNTPNPLQMYLDNIYFSNDTTNLNTTTCGSTLASLYTSINAVPVNGATDYRFQVTNGAEVQTIERTVPWFNLSLLPNFSYSTTYSVKVEYKKAGVWSGSFGESCNVTSPNIPVLLGTSCSSTIINQFTGIYTTALPGVTSYKFRITNLTSGIIEEETNIYNWFNFYMLDGFVYGTTYSVEVAVNTTSTNYSAYGASCNVSTPAVPGLLATSCGATINSNTAGIYTTYLNNVTTYRFELSNPTTGAIVQIIDRATNWFNFSQVTGHVAGTSYSVRLKLLTKGVYSDWGPSCIINPGAGAAARLGSAITVSTTGTEFKAVGYPNPFETNFTLNVTTASDEKVQVAVYDMIGKQLESKEVNAADTSSLEVGANYPSGVYNVVVSQGENVKSLRMIKR